MAKKIRYQNLTDFLLTNYRNINGLYSYINSNGITEFDSFESSSIGSSFKTDEKATTLISTNGVMPLGVFIGENVTSTIPLLNNPFNFQYKLSRIDKYVDRSGIYFITIKWVELDITETFSGSLNTQSEITFNSTQLASENFTIEISGTVTDSFNFYSTILTLTNPTSLSSYLSGEEFNITWTTNNPTDTGNVNIDLYYGDGLKANIATNVIDTGTYVYEFPLDYDFNTGYYIVVSKVLGNAQVTSDVFELLPTTLTLTNPLGGELFDQEQTINITWTDNNIYDNSNVNIYLYLNNVSNLTIASNILDIGSYDYVIPTEMTSSPLYSIKVEKVNNTNIFSESGDFRIGDLLTETIPLTLLRAGNVNNTEPFPGVFTSVAGNGLSSQNNTIFPSYLIDQGANIYNMRDFFYTDLGSVTNTTLAGKLYMKRNTSSMIPVKDYYLYKGTQPKSSSFGSVTAYSAFTTLLSTKSTRVGDFIIFTLNAAGIAELTNKGQQGFCIRNHYDVELINPLGINDTSGFTLDGSYFELNY